MKKTSILAIIWVIISSFASHYKQITLAATFISPLVVSAQFYTEYRAPYKAAFYPGNWSGKDLYVVRDEADGLIGEFKFNIPIKPFTLALPHNDGAPNNIVWLGSDTILKLSPISTLSLSATQLTGVSITGTGGTTVSGTGLNLTINTPTVQGNITPTITTTGILTSTVSGNTFTISAPAQTPQTLSGSGTNTITLSDGGGTFVIPTGTVSPYTAGNGINITSNVISLTANTTNTVTRPITSTSFTISATQDQIVNYNVFAQITSALVGNNTAYLYLETSPNNSTWTTIAQSGIGVSGLVSTMGNTQTLTGTVLKGYWVRIRQVATGANSGSAVFTYQSGNETPK